MSARLTCHHHTIQDSPKVVCLALGGEIDHENEREAEKYFEERVDKETPQHLLLDLTNLTFAASPFFGALLFWKETLKARQGKLVLFAVNQELNSTMRLFTIDRLLSICPDQNTALAEANRTS